MDMGESLNSLLLGPKFPDREFVRSGATFGEVYAMAAGLCATWTNPEYPGGPICLATENKAVLAAALLAALAGGPTLLLPYAFSAQALAGLRQLTGFTTAISDVAREFPNGTKVICPQQNNPAKLPTSALMPERELLKIFTGGSTGAPQLWSKTGANLFGEGFFLAQHFTITEKDCILATVPPYHIYGLLFSVLLPLVSSATIIADTPSFPAEIAGAVPKHGATVLAGIPAHYRALREKNLTAAALRLAFSSAGMLDAEVSETFSRQNRVGIVEVYGSTETGGIAARNRSLGETYFTAFPTVSWTVKEQRICVRSPYLSPDLPLAADGFFTTGDRVEAGGTNAFALLGRIDGVTKVGGKRVDLEEVRAIIKKEPGVKDCVVMALPESGGREYRLVALIQGTAVDLDLVRKNLAHSLEPHGLPRLLKTVAQIPMKENGKYDREAIAGLFKT